ncbi:MAG: hypothetical protein K0S38_968 [Candidatus Paceibacter sp.]|jgi:hypothetical protein|nr:hypothetical protein [Candidatus Paceibacter sp.]
MASGHPLELVLVQELEKFHFEVVKIIQLSPDRPFAVMTVQNEGGGPIHICKMALPQSDPGKAREVNQAMLSEIDFVQHVEPFLMSKLPIEFRERIALPEYIFSNKDGDMPFLVEERFTGTMLGDIHRADLIIVNNDLRIILGFIRALNELPVDFVKKVIPTIVDRTSNPHHWYERAKNEMEKYRGPLEQVVAPTDLELMANFLTDQQGFVDDFETPVFTAGDINPSNIMLLPDERLGFFDWERIKITTSPVHDYGFMYVDLWEAPNLQQWYLDAIFNVQTDMGFWKMMRFDVLFNRCIGEINHWTSVLKRNPSHDAGKIAHRALGFYAKEVHNILQLKDRWARGS